VSRTVRQYTTDLFEAAPDLLLGHIVNPGPVCGAEIVGDGKAARRVRM
jgi:hypothetical protein